LHGFFVIAETFVFHHYACAKFNCQLIHGVSCQVYVEKLSTIVNLLLKYNCKLKFIDYTKSFITM